MKRILFSLVLSVFAAGIACAGMQAAQSDSFVPMPEPCSVVLCAFGAAFLYCTVKRVP
ncbi:MAG: hypothetical protein LLF76_14090 [Planctomycetaceae bacterium]|nr:hypothetical protein [Planctomycetaceae bacterium]